MLFSSASVEARIFTTSRAHGAIKEVFDMNTYRKGMLLGVLPEAVRLPFLSYRLTNCTVIEHVLLVQVPPGRADVDRGPDVSAREPRRYECQTQTVKLAALKPQLSLWAARRVLAGSSDANNADTFNADSPWVAIYDDSDVHHRPCAARAPGDVYVRRKSKSPGKPHLP